MTPWNIDDSMRFLLMVVGFGAFSCFPWSLFLFHFIFGSMWAGAHHPASRAERAGWCRGFLLISFSLGPSPISR